MQRTVLSSLPRYPSLPKWIEKASAGPDLALKDGCHRLALTLNAELEGLAPTELQGTFRVQSRELNQTRASGDLYTTLQAPGGTAPSPTVAQEIPTFPLTSYEAYLSLLDLSAADHALRLQLEVTRFRSSEPHWEPPGILTVCFQEPDTPGEIPPNTLKGIACEGEQLVGSAELTWISPWLRECVIQVDHEEGKALPEHEGWVERLKSAGWLGHVEIGTSFENPMTLGSESWSLHNLKKEIERLQQEVLLADPRWRTHLLAVGAPELDSWGRLVHSLQFGLFRHRVGAAVGADRKVAGSSGETKAHQEWPQLYSHTALHEIGHTIGLEHDREAPAHSMSVSSGLQSLLSTFPDQVPTQFEEGDRRLLGHLPDPHCRPGGLDTLPGDQATGKPLRIAEGVRLKLHALGAPLPLGAPLRLVVEVASESGEAFGSKTALSLTVGVVEGTIWTASGTRRSFRTSELQLEPPDDVPLEKARSLVGSEQFLWGSSAPFTPVAGSYRIEARVRWRDSEGWKAVFSTEDFEVAPARPGQQEEAAEVVLQDPRAQIILASGGEEPFGDSDVLQKVLDSKELRSHWAAVDVQRLLHRGLPLEAARRLEAGAVLTDQEVSRISRGFLRNEITSDNASEVRKAYDFLEAGLAALPAPASSTAHRELTELRRRIEEVKGP